MDVAIVTAILLCAFMTAVWAVYLYYKEPAIVDIAWAASIGVGSVCYFFLSPAHTSIRWATLLCVLLWSARLCSLLTWRLVSGIKDTRYEALTKEFGAWKEWKYLLFYYAQALGAFVMLIPMMYIFIDEGAQWNWIATLASIWYGISFVCEAWADYTLAHFKSERKGDKQICDEGLWRYSRHPNYFFEVQIWVAIALFAGASSPDGYWALITPGVLLILVLYVTGVPPTESRALEKYGEKYRAYQEKTSPFIPWFRSNA